MAIYKTHKSQNYSTIDNRIFEAENLSRDSKLVLLYLLSKPCDWHFYNAGIQKALDISKYKLQICFKELTDAGYVQRQRVHQDGRWLWITDIYEQPQVQLTMDKNSMDENSMHRNTSDCKSSDIENINKETIIDTKHDVTNSEKEFSQSKPVDKPVDRRDLVFETVCEVTGIDWNELTKRSRGAIGKAVKELKEVNATPDEIRLRANVYHFLWPTIKLTPMALANRWAECHPNNAKHIMSQKQRDHHLEQYEQDRFWEERNQEAKELTDGY